MALGEMLQSYRSMEERRKETEVPLYKDWELGSVWEWGFGTGTWEWRVGNCVLQACSYFLKEGSRLLL